MGRASWAGRRADDGAQSPERTEAKKVLRWRRGLENGRDTTRCAERIDKIRGGAEFIKMAERLVFEYSVGSAPIPLGAGSSGRELPLLPLLLLQLAQQPALGEREALQRLAQRRGELFRTSGGFATC